MKSWLTLIVAFIFWCPQQGLAKTADLIAVRAGEHARFTRIVFEFQQPVRFQTPTIKGRGKFSVLLYDTSSSLDSQKSCKVSQHVQSVEFVPQTPHLEADIVLSIPYFGLKAYPLSSPDRVVIDAYRSSPHHSKVDQNHSLYKRTTAGTLDNPARDNTAKVSRKKSTKVRMGFRGVADNKSFPRKPSLMTETPLNGTRESVESSSGKVVRQATVSLKRKGKNLGENQNYQPGEDDTLYEFPSWTNRLEIPLLMLMLLSLSTVVVIVLIILSRLNHKRAVGSKCSDNTSSSVKTYEVSSSGLRKTLRRDQKKIAILDDRIQEEIDLLMTNESIPNVDSCIRRALKTNGNS